MYIRRPKWKSQNGRTYQAAWLCESYRAEGKSKTKYLLNLGHCQEETLNAIEYALRNTIELDEKFKRAAAGRKRGGKSTEAAVECRQGKSIGAVWAVKRIAEELGIVKVLGEGRQAQLALWQIIARVVHQGSRLGAVRLHDVYALAETVGLDADFTEDDLYANLAWLAERQSEIEHALFKNNYAKEKSTLYLYDVTSSYLEGQKNALGAYGYNRDGKKGKKQIVIGLLTDVRGEPISVEVFHGNTLDFKTLEAQIKKAAENFGCREVTFVGDRGMIKSGQIEALQKTGFHYITALTKPQIEKLLNDKTIQLGLFDDEICEMMDGARRLILRRNPDRAEDISASRQFKRESMESWLERENSRLSAHKRAHPELAMEQAAKRLKKLRLDSWTRVRLSERTLVLEIDAEALTEESRLDGCYVLVTDVPVESADALTVHARYKDLSRVEQAFRISKTGHLELRPVYVRKESSTRGHVFVVMLSYLIRRRLSAAWQELDLTVEEGLDALKTLCAHELKFGVGPWVMRIPEPSRINAELLSRLGVTLPGALPRCEATVGRRRKLSRKRLI